MDFDPLLIECHAAFGEVDPICWTSSDRIHKADITGIFDRAFTRVMMVGDQPITTIMPVLGVRLAAFPVPPGQGDQLTIGSEAYIVREVELDGHGAAKLMLNGADAL